MSYQTFQLNLKLTETGYQRIFSGAGYPINIKYIALGSANGNSGYEVNFRDDRTALLNEVVRKQIDASQATEGADPETGSPSKRIDYATIFTDSSNFDVWEVGFFDENGDLIYIWSAPDQSFAPKREKISLLVSIAQYLLFQEEADAINVVDAGYPMELFIQSMKDEIDTKVVEAVSTYADEYLGPAILRSAVELSETRDEMDQRLSSDGQRIATLEQSQSQQNTNIGDLQRRAATAEQNDDKHIAHILELGAVMAWTAESEAAYRRTMGQTGIFGVRQYTWHGDLRQPHTENGQPAHMHNHVEYIDTCGSGEVQFVVNGYLGATRHRDFKLLRAADTGSDWLQTTSIPPPPRPAVVESGTVDERITAMHDLFNRFAGGEFPDGFGWTLAALEVWIEPFAEAVSDASASDRHQQEVSTISAALRELLKYHASGLKNRFENLAMELPMVRWLDANGEYQIGIMKHRMICADVSSLGDLRPYIDDIYDPLRFAGFGSESNRFKIAENGNKPGKLDEIMALLPGLDGAGAYLEERYWETGAWRYINTWDNSTRLNAASYNRMAQRIGDDAANMSKFIRGFNDPYLFVASNTRPECMSLPINGQDYRFSYAIPMELILRTPLEGWNPLGVAYDASIPRGDARGASSTNPLPAYNNQNYYLLPPEFFGQSPSPADAADTAIKRWVLGDDGQPHYCYGAGQWVEYPKIPGIGRIRKRYAIYPEHQEGSKAWMYAEAVYRETGTASLRNAMALSDHMDAMDNMETRLRQEMAAESANRQSADVVLTQTDDALGAGILRNSVVIEELLDKTGA